MAKKTRGTHRAIIPGGHSTPAERVIWLLKMIWNDNRSAMAHDIGVTHSVLGKIAAGQQNPGRRLLSALASHPKVNPGWLLAGEGNPLLAENPEGPAEGWPVRIATQLLPGPLEQHRQLLTDQSFPVAAAFYRPSRYWYRVGMRDRVVSARWQRIAGGDLLLMDSDRQAWHDLHSIDNHFCAALHATGGLQLGVVRYDRGDAQEPAQLSLDVFEETVAPENQFEDITIRRFPDGKLELPRTRIRLRNMASATPLKPLSSQEIVAICVLVVRYQF